MRPCVLWTTTGLLYTYQRVERKISTPSIAIRTRNAEKHIKNN